MFIILVGPKGSGKSHIGRTIESALGVHFFHVEPLWMDYHAQCKAVGQTPSIPQGIAIVHPQIEAAIRTHGHVCIETTGASPAILNSLLTLQPASNTLVVRISAPLELCLERIFSRDQTHQIPMATDQIREVYALSMAADIKPAFTLENVNLSTAEIVANFQSFLTAKNS